MIVGDRRAAAAASIQAILAETGLGAAAVAQGRADFRLSSGSTSA